MQYVWSQISNINILVDWSLSGIMTSKRVIRESESPRPAALSILISRMTSSSVFILYRKQLLLLDRMNLRCVYLCHLFLNINISIPYLIQLNSKIVTSQKRLRIKCSNVIYICNFNYGASYL